MPLKLPWLLSLGALVMAPLWAAAAQVTNSDRLTGGWCRSTSENGPLLQTLLARLNWQRDGNLVIYQDGRPLWASRTHGRGTELCFRAGHLHILGAGEVILWSSGTDSISLRTSDGRYLRASGSSVRADATQVNNSARFWLEPTGDRFRLQASNGRYVDAWVNGLARLTTSPPSLTDRILGGYTSFRRIQHGDGRVPFKAKNNFFIAGRQGSAFASPARAPDIGCCDKDLQRVSSRSFPFRFSPRSSMVNDLIYL